ncbi:MAG: hypothetical protein HC769_13455 [Cyanobacteria bacterium CRU_2_1]|nr:hypothetical protein [Cyanobacteria bacterium CRU_2_1]
MEKSYHLTPEAFRYWGHQVIDWIASEYYEKLEEFPVLAQVKPGEIRSHLPDTPPIEGESVDAILKDFADIIVPGLTQWQSPNWFAYYPSNSSPITVIAELLIAAVNNQGMLWQTSPSCTELETLMTDWFVQALGLPDHFQHKQGGGGVLQDSASSGCLCAMIAARKQALDREQEEQSWFSSVDKSVQPQLNEFSQLDKSRNILTKIKMVVKHLLENQQKPGLQRLSAYISSETHASVIKNFRILFGGTQNLRIIPVDEQFGMRSDLLESRFVMIVEEG